MGIPVSPAGFPYETLDILDYALYTPVYINFDYADIPVEYENTHHYLGVNEVMIPYADQFAAEHSVSGYRTTLHPDFYMDPSHKKFQYNWDYTYDGVTFNNEGSGLPTGEIEYATPGRKIAAMRIRTNSVPPQEYITEIPVYAEGLGYTSQVPASYANGNTTSYNRSHSIRATEEYVYLVYSSLDPGSGNRDIWLALMDRHGSFIKNQITDDSNVDDHPSLLVDTNPPGDGLYIAYSRFEDPSYFVYVNKGNLDGTGFDQANAKRVTDEASAIEFTPVLFPEGYTIGVYFINTPVVASRIYGSHSEDFGETWNYDGWLVDNGSMGQMDPALCSGGYSRNAMVWQDNVNSAETGLDLWMAETTDGYTFSEMRNITSFTGIVDEMSPSVYYFDGQAVIAYLAEVGSSVLRTRLKFISLSPYFDSHTDYEIDYTIPALTHTMPAIAYSGNGHNFVSFGAYDTSTNQLTAYLLDVQVGGQPGDFDVIELLKQPIGTADPSTFGDEIFPAIATYRPIPNVREVFLAYRDISSGSTSSTDVPVNTYGEIQVSYFITEAEYNP